MRKSFKLRNIFVSLILCVAMVAAMFTAFAVPVKSKAQAAPNDRINSGYEYFNSRTSWYFDDNWNTTFTQYNRAEPSGNNLLCYQGDEETIAFSGGNGSKGHPFIITDVDDLFYFQVVCSAFSSGSLYESYHKGKYFKVIADDAGEDGRGGTIDLGNYLWGDYYGSYYSTRIAEFDGNGVTIKNLAGNAYGGLFGYDVYTSSSVYPSREDININVDYSEGVTYSGAGLDNFVVLKDFNVEGATMLESQVLFGYADSVIVDNVSFSDCQTSYYLIAGSVYNVCLSDIVVEEDCYISGTYGANSLYLLGSCSGGATLTNIFVKANYSVIFSDMYLWSAYNYNIFENIHRYGVAKDPMFGYIYAEIYEQPQSFDKPMLKFKNCTNNASVESLYTIAGFVREPSFYLYDGIDIGDYKPFVFENCGNTGNITLSGTYNYARTVSGFVSNINYSELTDCYNTGNIITNTTGGTGKISVSGFASSITDSNLTGCYNSGNILVNGVFPSVESPISGFAEKVENTSLEGCYNSGNIFLATAEIVTTISGFCYSILINGNALQDILVKDCYNSGNINLNSIMNITNINGFAYRMGSLSKTSKTITFENCYNEGHLSFSYPFAAGVISGFAYSVKFATLKNCGNKQSGTSPYSFVMIYGFAYEVIRASLEDCYNEANLKIVDGIGDSGLESYIAGFAGVIRNSDLKGCYNSGNLETYTQGYIYGFAEIIETDSSVTQSFTIQDCYNSGDLIYNTPTMVIPIVCNVGLYGFAGRIGNSAMAVISSIKVSNCYNTGKFITVTVDGNAVDYAYILDLLASYNTKKISESKPAVNESERFDVIELLFYKFFAPEVVSGAGARQIGTSVVNNIYGSGLNLSEQGLLNYILGDSVVKTMSEYENVNMYGFCKDAKNQTFFENCFNSSDLIAKNEASGFLWTESLSGINGGSNFENCYNLGNIISQYSFGFIKSVFNSDFYNCYNTGDIYKVGRDNGILSGSTPENSYVAGLIGRCYGNFSSTTVDHCFNSGNIYTVAQMYVSGIVGNMYIWSGTERIKNSYNTGNINVFKAEFVANANAAMRIIAVAGILGGCMAYSGRTNFPSIYYSFNTGNVIVHNTDTTLSFYTAGIFAQASRNLDTSEDIEVSNCYNTGTIFYGTGNQSKGLSSGIVNATYSGSTTSGYNRNFNIINCYNIGTILGDTARIASIAWLRAINYTYTYSGANIIAIVGCFALGQSGVKVINGDATYYQWANGTNNRLYINNFSHTALTSTTLLFPKIEEMAKTSEELKNIEIYSGLKVNGTWTWDVNPGAKPNDFYWVMDESGVINDGFPYLEGSNTPTAVVFHGLNGKNIQNLLLQKGGTYFGDSYEGYDLYEANLADISPDVIGYDFYSWYFKGYNSSLDLYSHKTLDKNSRIILLFNSSSRKFFLFAVISGSEVTEVYTVDNNKNIEVIYIFQVTSSYNKTVYNFSKSGNITVQDSPSGSPKENFQIGEEFIVLLPAKDDLKSFATLKINGYQVPGSWYEWGSENLRAFFYLTEEMISAYNITAVADGSGFVITAEYVNSYAKMSVIKNDNSMIASIKVNGVTVTYGEPLVFLLGSTISLTMNSSVFYKLNSVNPYLFNTSITEWVHNFDGTTFTFTLPPAPGEEEEADILEFIITANIEKNEFLIETGVRLKRSKTIVENNLPVILNNARVVFDSGITGLNIEDNNYFKFVNWVVVGNSGTEYYISDFVQYAFPETFYFTKDFITEYLNDDGKIKILAEVYTKVEAEIKVDEETFTSGRVTIVGVFAEMGGLATDERSALLDVDGKFINNSKLYVVSGSRIGVVISFKAGYTLDTTVVTDSFTITGKNGNFTITFTTAFDSYDTATFNIKAIITSYFISFEYLDTNNQVLSATEDPYFEDRPTATISGTEGTGSFNPNIGEHGAYEFYVTDFITSIIIPATGNLKEYKFIGWFYKLNDEYISVSSDYFGTGSSELAFGRIDDIPDFMLKYFDQNENRVVLYAMFVKQITISVFIPEEFKDMGSFTVMIAGILRTSPDAVVEGGKVYVASLADEAIITANVTNATYYQFVGFNMTANGNICTFIVDANKNVILTYKTLPQTIQFSKNIKGAKGDVSINKQEVEVGDTLILTFNPDTGYDLSSWTINGKRVQDLVSAANSNYYLNGNTLRITVTEEWLNENINLSTIVKTTMNKTYLIILLSFGSVVPVLIVLIAVFLVLNAKKKKQALEILRKRQESAAMMNQASMITALKEGVSVGPQGTEISQKDIHDQMKRM